MPWSWKQFLSVLSPTKRRGPWGYPKTYDVTGSDKRMVRPKVFDPAMAHFPHGFRRGEPAFEDPALAARWRAARRRAMYAFLEMVDRSPWKENLVLRGSVLLQAWFGERAREPGDLDWVVQPASIRITDAKAKEIIRGLIAEIDQQPRVAGDSIEFVPAQIATDDIWTYDRAPGTRIVFPWRGADLPPGAVQCDFVFSESLPLRPVQTPIPDPDGGAGVTVWTASKELSLAWKLQWLETDIHPQGKDLYDAAILAADVAAPAAIVQQLVGKPRLAADFPLNWDVDWDNFLLEYPRVTGTAKEWQERLARAIAPAFSGDHS